ncbi:MFS transporter [Rothia sp. ZJ1223]|uniref:MFS transporter n=1 Tax=Rothia sp. ZJ1223 TaxID=2811098 RepID=UPI00195A1328|nr:MFS transporter [Rothia sp. ZJ1223]MBM7051581.1 MFS transporter [Rothia sp. ZJ1223]
MPITTTIPLRAGTKQWLALAVLMLPVLLISVDNTVLSFALPKISRVMAPTGTQLLWMVDIYPLVLAALLVPMGALGDKVGRRTLLLVGCVGFAVVSAFASFAPDAIWLIAARGALGFFGAMLMPATLSLLRNIFLDPNQRRAALAIWASGFSAGAVLGPVMGGFLLEHFWWGSIFFIATLILIPALILMPLLVPNSRSEAPGSIDPLSIMLVMAAMFGLVYALKVGATEGLEHLSIYPAALVGAVTTWAFVRRQNKLENPMLDMSLFHSKTFTGGLLSNLITMTSMTGFMIFYSQYVQLVVGLTPMQAGLTMLPGVLCSIFSGLFVVRLAQSFRPAHLVAAALTLAVTGYTFVAAGGFTGASFLIFVLGFMLLGLGNGAAQTLANDAIIGGVDANKAGAASAVSETAYEFGSVLGAAILGTVLTAIYRLNVQVPAGYSTTDQHIAQETLGGAMDAATRYPEPAASALISSAQNAFSLGVGYSSIVAVALCSAGIISALTLLKSLPKARDNTVRQGSGH